MPSGSCRRPLIVIKILKKKSVRALRFARSTNGGSGLPGKVERANMQKPHAEYDYNANKSAHAPMAGIYTYPQDIYYLPHS